MSKLKSSDDFAGRDGLEVLEGVECLDGAEGFSPSSSMIRSSFLLIELISDFKVELDDRLS